MYHQKTGLIPDAAFYDKRYGKGKWGFVLPVLLVLVRAEITTPVQVANEMAYIANKKLVYNATPGFN